MLPVIDQFKTKYKLSNLVVIAYAGLMSGANIRELQSKGYRYIIGSPDKEWNEGSRKADPVSAIKEWRAYRHW